MVLWLSVMYITEVQELRERERERGVGTVWWLWETVGVWERPKREQRKGKENGEMDDNLK